MIYQVSVGKPSNLYTHCIDSVSRYCEKYGIDHIVQTTPKLWIKPDPFTSNRSKEAVSRVGCLPIYEKENAFDYIDKYDRIAIIDADIYVRPDALNIMDELDCGCAFGAVSEREMDITPKYVDKIRNYSHMQYAQLHQRGLDFKPNDRGYEFFNMGMMLINCDKFKPFLKNQTPEQFIKRDEFKDFVDGKGAYKWSTDQTLLNYFLKKYGIKTKKINPKFNGLYSAVNNINECYFVHFFLKDKLPAHGENVEELMEKINAT
jgi:lipopolysaccharide biosynthesis glycosyltransferase